MTMRRLTTVLVGAIAGIALGLGPSVAAETPDEGSALLQRARDRLADARFEGVVLVEWRDIEGLHRARVAVRGSQGSIEVVAARRFVSTATGGFVQVQNDWTTVQERTEIDVVPIPAAKYDLVVASGPDVVGRSTTVVEATLPGVGVVERVFLDDASGLLLRRERLDAAGAVVRAVSFEEITIGARPTVAVPDEARATDADPRGRIDGAYRDPDRAGDGFTIVSRTMRPDGVAHLLYSDGLLTVSVFEQPGTIAWETLPAGGSPAEVDGVAAVQYRTAVGTATVWARDGIVYTTVSDAPAHEVAELAESVSGDRQDNRLARFARAVLAPFEL